MNKILILIGTLLITSYTFAGDVKLGKEKSSACAGCHGLNGMSRSPQYPNIAGQKEAYLIKAIKDYRDGQRKDAMMSSMVKTLKDSDIEDLAAYFASRKP